MDVRVEIRSGGWHLAQESWCIDLIRLLGYRIHFVQVRCRPQSPGRVEYHVESKLGYNLAAQVILLDALAVTVIGTFRTFPAG